MLHIYLHPEEDKFVRNYAEKNFYTVAELIRGWIHEVMKREGFKIAEPRLPGSVKKKNQTSKSEKLKNKTNIGRGK